MRRLIVGEAPEVEIDFTDEAITGVAGGHIVARMALLLGLPGLLAPMLKLKKRDRGACDAEMVLSTVFSLASGDGALADVERLRADEARRETLGLNRVPSSRRLGEYFARFGERDVEILLAIVRIIAAKVAPSVVEHLIATHGSAPVFIDGSAIEVDGQYWDGDQRLLRPRFIFILVSRTDEPLDEIVRRHRQKQGQENAQKGPLIDLDLHHPPCQRFQANRAFYACDQLAQMLLIAVQYQLLPANARRHGLRTLIRDVVRTCARLVRHGRKLVLRFAKSALRLDWIAHAADRLDALARAAPG